MTFTLTFNEPVTITAPVSGCNWSSSNGGTTYTTSDRPGALYHFYLQSWKDNLVSVTGAPTSVTYLDGSVFANCANLITVEIPSSVTAIYNYSFYNCPELTSVIFLGNSSLSLIDWQSFAYCPKLSNFIIPSSVTTINNTAFQNCTSLTSIVIPDGVTTLTDNCFYNCTSLMSITIPSTVTTFGNNEIFFNIPSNATPNSSNAATLYTTPMNNTNPVYNYFFTNFQNTINYYIPPCFKKDSKILSINGYVPIQNLRKGDLVKTISHGFLPIDMIGYREITNTICEERIKDKLYVCSENEYSEVFEDLIITGCHSILVDNFEEGQREKTIEINGDTYVTDDKYRLPACVDSRTKPYEKEGTFTVYHIALENDDYYMNYGIYANGLLVESTSKRYLKELSNMTLIE
jgi:BspA type Leucine rich repeat region (6 copies)/Hint domain